MPVQQNQKQMITLVRPQLEHKQEAIAFKEAFFSNGETVINGSAMFDKLDFEEWLDSVKRNSHPATVSKDWVVSSTFFVKRNSDQMIIGMLDIRHNLEQAFLRTYGGHIGISVKPSERKKGYATLILNAGLDYAKSIGITEVMLGCYVDNHASNKLIRNCGGTLRETKPLLYPGQTCMEPKDVNIYWIHLD